MQRHWIFAGAILAALAVGLGAFGAHGLDGFLLEKHTNDLDLAAKRLGDWKTAALYQMHHAIGLIVVGLVMLHRQNKWLSAAGWCFLIGILFFSGLLYALVLTEVRVLARLFQSAG